MKKLLVILPVVAGLIAAVLYFAKKDDQWIYFNKIVPENDQNEFFRASAGGKIEKVYGSSAGCIALYQGDVYFTAADAGGETHIFKTDADNIDIEPVITEEPVGNCIKFNDGYLYYIAIEAEGGAAYKLARMKPDGTEKYVYEKETDNIEDVFYVADGSIYFIELDSDLFGGSLYRMNLDGAQRQYINHASIGVRSGNSRCYFQLDGDWLYYQVKPSWNYMYKTRLDGSATENLNLAGINMTDYLVAGGYYYYLNESGGEEGVYRTNSLEIPGERLIDLSDIYATPYYNALVYFQSYGDYVIVEVSAGLEEGPNWTSNYYSISKRSGAMTLIDSVAIN